MRAHKNLSPGMQSTSIPNSFVLKGRRFDGLHALPANEAKRLYEDLIRYGNACGCNEGAVGVFVAIFLYALVGFGMPILLSVPVNMTWQMGVVIAVAGGTLGKILGLWWAKRSFEILQREFDRLATHPAKTKEHLTNPNQNGGISYG